jgi:hypothetical protein
MKKIRGLYKFYKKSGYKFSVLFRIISTILTLPLAYFHELLHFIFIYLTFTDYEIDKKRWYFLKIVKSGNEVSLRLILLSINLNSNNVLKLLVISISPVLCIPIYMFIMAYIPYIITSNTTTIVIITILMSLYLSMGISIMIPSDADISLFKMCANRLFYGRKLYFVVFNDKNINK